VPHRINSLICAVLSLCVWVSSAFSQATSPRPATSGTRSAVKPQPAPAQEESPRAAIVPRTTREPVGRATIDDEPADSAGPRPPAAKPPGAQTGPAPKLVFEPVSKEMKAVLFDWEEKTKDITSLACPITRIEFDSVFYTETRSMGNVYFENPDKGRIDFKPADEAFLAKRGRTDAQGKMFKVSPGSQTKWICTGKKIYILDMQNKQYDLVVIPPQSQGQNITRSPLPFIFGMKAQDAMQRFALRFGSFHNLNGKLLDKNGNKLPLAVHIVANPLQPQEAQEYLEAEIILDPTTFLPRNLRMIDPAGNKETVYSFDQNQLKVGVSWGLMSPFRDPILPGWTEIKRGNAEPPVRQTQNTEK
jgi:TIGR03009 family protein